MAKKPTKVDPAKRVSRDVYKKTLQAVNVIRKTLGQKALKKLPRGIPGKEKSCPIYFSLCSIEKNGGYVGGVHGSGIEIGIPNPFENKFIVGTTGMLVDDSIFDTFVMKFDAKE